MSMTMTTTAMSTLTATAPALRQGTRGHVTSLLTAVRAGDLFKVSTRCSCGWRDLAVARTREAAELAASHLSSHHVEIAAPHMSTAQAPVARKRAHSLGSDVRLVLITAAVMAFLVVGGFNVLAGGIGGGVDVMLAGLGG